MSEADRYRALAADAEARAQCERISQLRWKWEDLAVSYHHLAEEADGRFAAAGSSHPKPWQRGAIDRSCAEPASAQTLEGDQAGWQQGAAMPRRA
jgi:hypothetical protein